MKLSASKNRILHQTNLDHELWKEMLNNAIIREIMEGNLLQDRNEHGERDLKERINLLTNCNTRNSMEKANLCFLFQQEGLGLSSWS